MEKIIYFDNSSTTKPCQTAIEYMNIALKENWGNPSSLHTMGINAEQELSLAREAVADVISASPDEIYFTSGGTEANNLAIFGAVSALKKRGRRIVTTNIEHPSVLEPIKKLQNDGFEVIHLAPNAQGNIDDRDIKNAINKDTILVSIMLVNNETGAIQPVKAAADAIKATGAPALLHCDAVQAFGKMPINVDTLGVDLLSASSHKIHGPKGVGFLYKKRQKNIHPIFFGGGQQKSLRPGTENLPLICGFRGAIEELGSINANLNKTFELFVYAKQKICEAFPEANINSFDSGLPYILNFSLNTHRSETILHYLDSFGIFISSGSACAKGQKSHVMMAMGFDSKRIDSALRLSFNRFNTKDEIDEFCKALTNASKTLRKA